VSTHPATGVYGQSGSTSSGLTAGIGVLGITDSAPGAGVTGQHAGSGSGVSGTSQTGNGVYGQSGNTASTMTTGIGVSGITDNISGAGVLGENAGGGTGVSGTAGQFGTGVLGTGGNVGVAGNGGNTGVLGVTSKARGVGVWGLADSATGTGVLAENSFGGDGLKVVGKAAFSRSGVLTVAAGKSSATHSGVPLTSASLVLATLQQDRAGVHVRSAVPDVARHSFTVHLSKAVPAPTALAWFVIN
jgi:hypothetical protein